MHHLTSLKALKGSASPTPSPSSDSSPDSHVQWLQGVCGGARQGLGAVCSLSIASSIQVPCKKGSCMTRMLNPWPLQDR